MKQPFYKQIIPSIASTLFYHDTERSSVSRGLSYLYLLCTSLVFLSIIVFVIGYIGKVQSIPSHLAGLKQSVRGLYPAGLTVTYNNGSVKTNVDEPYSIDAPKSWNLGAMHLVTIDTKANAADISKYKTLVLVTKHAVVYPDKDNGYRIQVFEDKKGYYVITSQVYTKLIDSVSPYLDSVVPLIYVMTFFLLFLGPFIGGAAYLFGMVVYLFFAVMPVFIVAKIAGGKLSFKSLYAFSLNAITLSLLFQAAKSLGNFDVPLSFFVPYFVWMVIIVYSFKTDAVTPAPSES